MQDENEVPRGQSDKEFTVKVVSTKYIPGETDKAVLNLVVLDKGEFEGMLLHKWYNLTSDRSKSFSENEWKTLGLSVTSASQLEEACKQFEGLCLIVKVTDGEKNRTVLIKKIHDKAQEPDNPTEPEFSEETTASAAPQAIQDEMERTMLTLIDQLMNILTQMKAAILR